MFTRWKISKIMLDTKVFCYSSRLDIVNIVAYKEQLCSWKTNMDQFIALVHTMDF